jgi:RNA polymerase sigma-70 factor, ECF subfamily
MSDVKEDGKGQGPTTPLLSLLEGARGGDESAWQRLVARYRPSILGWCSPGGIAADDVEDVAQEVFVAVARGLGGVRREDTFRGWLRVVTRNQALLHFRRNQDEAVAEGGEVAWRRLQQVAGPEEREEEPMRLVCRRALEQVRREFEEPTWRAFWLTTIEERQPAALAGELGMSAVAIRQAKSRVLRRIKEELGDLPDGKIGYLAKVRGEIPSPQPPHKSNDFNGLPLHAPAA